LCCGIPPAAKRKIQKHPSPSGAGSDAQATRLELAGGRRRSQSAPPGHPARARYIVEAGLLARGSLFESVFPGSRPVTPKDSGSPLTVAGAAPLSLSNSNVRSLTGFPLSSVELDSPKTTTSRIWAIGSVSQGTWPSTAQHQPCLTRDVSLSSSAPQSQMHVS
jgi:hypothetical protein